MSVRELLGRMEIDKVVSTTGRINTLGRLRIDGKMWKPKGLHHSISTSSDVADTVAYMWIKRGADPDPLCQMFLSNNFISRGFRFEYPDDCSPAIVLAQVYAIYSSELAILN